MVVLFSPVFFFCVFVGGGRGEMISSNLEQLIAEHRDSNFEVINKVIEEYS